MHVRYEPNPEKGGRPHVLFFLRIHFYFPFFPLFFFIANSRSSDPAYDPATLRLLPSTAPHSGPSGTQTSSTQKPHDQHPQQLQPSDGLFVAGDSSGSFRGIVAAMVSGWYAGAQAGMFVRERHQQVDICRPCASESLAEFFKRRELEHQQVQQEREHKKQQVMAS